MKKLFALIICIFLVSSFAVSAENKQSVVDNDDLFSSNEEKELQNTISAISEKYNFDIVILTFDDLGGKDIKTFTADYFMDNGYGTGNQRDGLIFSVYKGRDTSVREFASLGHGCGEEATGAYFYESLFDSSSVVDKLSDDDFYDAVCEYLELADTFLAAYAKGTPYNSYNNEYEDPGFLNTGYSLTQLLVGALIVIVISIILAFMYVTNLKNKMNTARAAGYAYDYVRPGSFNLTRSNDFFIYSTLTSVRIKSDNSSSHSGGSSRSSGGSSFSGGSSRF